MICHATGSMASISPPRKRYEDYWCLLTGSKAHTSFLFHVDIFLLQPIGQNPIKTVQEIRKYNLYCYRSHVNPRTNSSTRSKWQILKTLSIEVIGAVQKSFREKLFRILPVPGVTSNCPHINMDQRLRIDIVEDDYQLHAGRKYLTRGKLFPSFAR
uniref:Uncharacterized protein n=2 Tax=Salix viminalis TaxID=40686 RepID=A0A6N2N5A7_SALVM